MKHMEMVMMDARNMRDDTNGNRRGHMGMKRVPLVTVKLTRGYTGIV